MKNKAVFLDRDGTINVDRGYVYKIENLQLIPGVIEGLKKLQDYSNYKLIIVTDQSGIARGYYTEESYLKFREYMHRVLAENGVIINEEYFCPHIDEDNCNCRKPKAGMLKQAAKDFNLDLKECWMMGDKVKDILAGKNAGCRAIHILTGEEKNPITYADFVAKDLVDAADYILNNKNK